MPNINLQLVFTDKHDEVGFNRNTVEMCTCVFQMKSLALIWRCLILWRGRGGGVEREGERVGGPCGVTLRLARCLSSAGSRRLSLSLCDQWVRGGRRATHNGESGVRLR